MPTVNIRNFLSDQFHAVTTDTLSTARAIVLSISQFKCNDIMPTLRAKVLSISQFKCYDTMPTLRAKVLSISQFKM